MELIGAESLTITEFHSKDHRWDSFHPLLSVVLQFFLAEFYQSFLIYCVIWFVGPVTGSATDWIKRNTNIKYVYVFELPPEYKSTVFIFIDDKFD